MNSAAYGQHTTLIDDTLHYCTTEPVTRFLLSEHLENRVNRDMVINLTTQTTQYQEKITELEGKVKLLEAIGTETTQIIELIDEKQELTEKEVKQLKRKAVGEWFKNNYEKLVIGAGGLGIGFGVGYLAK